MMSSILLLVVAGLLLAGCSKDRPGETEYAVVIYGTAGGEMDEVIEDVWKEVQEVLPGKRVRVLCRYKYGKGGETFTGKWGDPGEVISFELTADTSLEGLRARGVQNSGYALYSPESLAEMLAWAKREASPTRGYVLILYGHGGGFDPSVDYPKEEAVRSVLYDEWFEGRTGMNMYEVAQAVEQSGIGHLSGLLFHDCLMGNLESLVEVASCADYLIATPFLLSSENTPLMPYLIKNLSGNSFEAAARQTVRESKDRLADGLAREDPAHLPGNIALLKSSELAGICDAAKTLATRLCQLYPLQRNAIDRATCKAYRFYNGDPFFDLLDYARILADETKDAELGVIALALSVAFDRAILAQEVVGFGIWPEMELYSLSVVLVDKETYNSSPAGFSYRQSYEYSAFHRLTGWGSWLDTNLQQPTGNPCGQVL